MTAGHHPEALTIIETPARPLSRRDLLRPIFRHRRPAALLFAVSPLPVYYDRYFIHESLFCAATFGLILSGWYAFKSRSIRMAAIAGACAAVVRRGATPCVRKRCTSKEPPSVRPSSTEIAPRSLT